MRTQEEKQRQIDGILKQKEKLPEFSFFGDNNWNAMDAMIMILKGEKSYEHFEYAENYVESEAYRANEWLLGNDDEDLFDE